MNTYTYGHILIIVMCATFPSTQSYIVISVVLGHKLRKITEQVATYINHHKKSAKSFNPGHRISALPSCRPVY